MIRSEPFDARLVSAKMLSPSVREMVFEKIGAEKFLYDAGQWVNLVLPLADGEVKRAYSIASAPSDSPRFEIAVTRVSGGAGSQYLHDLHVGATLRAIGPQGLFTRDIADESPSLFVCTGTGVTPLRAMVHAAVRAGARVPLWLLFGARYEADILYKEEFEALAKLHPNVRYEITLSQPDASWKGRRGYVQAHVPELFRELKDVSSPAAPHAYVCGLQRMVSSVRDLLREQLGADRKHVHQERYD